MRETRFRASAGLKIERRAASGDAPAKSLIVGHAIVFNQWTTLYEGRYWTWREMVRPGATKNALAEGQDVRSLFNHDPNFVLGRTVSKTLALREDEVGLWSETDPPATQTIADLVLAPIERQDVTGMSFAMSIRSGPKRTETENDDGSVTIEDGGQRVTFRYEGERLIEEREILDIDLFDVSPVTYPAYEGTDVALRSRLLGEGFEARVREMDRPHESRRGQPRQAHRRDRRRQLRLAEAEL